MSDSSRNSVLTLGKQIGTLFDLGALGAMPDRSLLDHFACGGEAAEAAFATLVERHGPMVLRVCRHVLADGHLAEDAFQVTFLLLARRARTIHDPDALAGWLHRVARRVAVRARAGSHRLKEREERWATEIAVADDNRLQRDELCAIVHEEIDRLADSQRLPILLCALEGLSHEEAAHRLRWPLGTVKSRLVRGRRSLQSRLARRGFAPALMLAAASADTPAAVPLVLAMATTKAALRSNLGTKITGANVSASIARLLDVEMRVIFVANVRLAAGALIAIAALGIGITLTGRVLGNSREVVAPPGAASPAASSAPGARTKARAGGRNIARGTSEAPAENPVARQEDRIVVRPERRLSKLGEQVERAIREGTRFLKSQQRPNGSWTDVDYDTRTGMTSLVAVALLAGGEKTDSPTIKKSLEFLRGFGPNDLRSTYAISLQTMAFAAADPARDIRRIADNVKWLEDAQIKPGDPQQKWPGTWSYSESKLGRRGDNSNTQYALQGLQAANEVGVPVKQTVWALSRTYWEISQKRDGSWAYTPDSNTPTASMTCAGISSLMTTGAEHGEDHGGEFFQDGVDRKCGARGAYVNTPLQKTGDWLARHLRVDQNFGAGNQWRFYYLCDLERVGRLTGKRSFGQLDWYRLGAEALIHEQDKLNGSWQGALAEKDPVLATSFALLFLAKGRAPVLINKLRFGPGNDWNNDPDDVRNLVGIVSRDWKHLLTWQMVDSGSATVLDLLRAPILFFNGHKAPEFSAAERANLRAYVEEGGTIVAEACCGSADFDRGFRRLMEEMFPDKKDQLRRLPDNHAILRGTFLPDSERHTLWGIDRAARTAVIYSPRDLSCYWNQSERIPLQRVVFEAIKLGENMIDYATGRVLPPDKLSER
jgi:RNA polymerase sigma factor (sigma-70 family)